MLERGVNCNLTAGTLTNICFRCALRFPSTQIIIIFDAAERFIDQYSTSDPKNVSGYAVGITPKGLKALTVQVADNGRVDELKAASKSFFSPCPSPSGTMRYSLVTTRLVNRSTY